MERISSLIFAGASRESDRASNPTLPGEFSPSTSAFRIPHSNCYSELIKLSWFLNERAACSMGFPDALILEVFRQHFPTLMSLTIFPLLRGNSWPTSSCQLGQRFSFPAPSGTDPAPRVCVSPISHPSSAATSFFKQRPQNSSETASTVALKTQIRLFQLLLVPWNHGAVLCVQTEPDNSC